MNKQEKDVLLALHQHPGSSQRVLAELSGHSLGIVNRSIKALTEEQFLTKDGLLTEKALQELTLCKPKNAVILAAGFGMRMVPINTEVPKALLKVHGQTLIERLICQLHEAGIRDISIVVGFLKERFEYLIDTYGVKLIVNPEYAAKNNLHSLALAASKLGNTYVVPCDIWCRDNPFRKEELYSWYAVSEEEDPASTLRVARNGSLTAVSAQTQGNRMVGISYLTQEDAQTVNARLSAMDQSHRYDEAFWEETLWESGRFLPAARVFPNGCAVEINTYEDLRTLDGHSDQLRSDAINTICQALQAKPSEVTGITVLKKGMTNRSFLFTCRGRQYIMRVPGEGTDRLINRRQEASVYDAIASHKLCDDIVYINPENGYKITAFLENARVCDPEDVEDLKKCMSVLRSFHRKKLTVDHIFDLFGQIEFYESLWEGEPSVYQDYLTTKKNVLSLKDYIDAHAQDYALTHIDAVPDNFLFAGDDDIRLIDWEYAGMQDPHVDVAMFCIYALYDKPRVDRLIDLYFPEGCPTRTRIKIYCYVAVCGLLWSNWCEYKRQLGVEFGEYSLQQYRYAKEYFRHAKALMEQEGIL